MSTTIKINFIYYSSYPKVRKKQEYFLGPQLGLTSACMRLARNIVYVLQKGGELSSKSHLVESIGFTHFVSILRLPLSFYRFGQTIQTSYNSPRRSDILNICGRIGTIGSDCLHIMKGLRAANMISESSIRLCMKSPAAYCLGPLFIATRLGGGILALNRNKLALTKVSKLNALHSKNAICKKEYEKAKSKVLTSQLALSAAVIDTVAVVLISISAASIASYSLLALSSVISIIKYQEELKTT